MLHTSRDRVLSFLIPLVLIAAATWLPTKGRVIQKRAAFYIANETMCIVDGEVYRNGDPVPTDDHCERCTCRPPGFSCVLRDCDTKPGCKALRREGECCPEYICGCVHNQRVYEDGEVIRDLQNACYTCTCHGSSISCTFADCNFRSDCVPEYMAGECCPKYDHCPPLSTTSSTTISITNRPIIQQEELDFINMTTLHLEKFTSDGTTVTIEKISPSTVSITTPSGDFETERVTFTVDFTLSEGKGSSILDYDTSVLTTLIPPQSVPFTETTKYVAKLSTVVETSSKATDDIESGSTQAMFTDTESTTAPTEVVFNEIELITKDEKDYSVSSTDITYAGTQKAAETSSNTEFETETVKPTTTVSLFSEGGESNYSTPEEVKFELQTSEQPTISYSETIIADDKEHNSSDTVQESTRDTMSEASFVSTTSSTDTKDLTSPVSWIGISTETVTDNSTIIDFNFVVGNKSDTVADFGDQTTQFTELVSNNKDISSSLFENQNKIDNETTTSSFMQTEFSFGEEFNSTAPSTIETEKILDSDVTESLQSNKDGLTSDIKDLPTESSNEVEITSQSEPVLSSNTTDDSDISTSSFLLPRGTSDKPFVGDELTTSISIEKDKSGVFEINLLETFNNTLEFSQNNKTLTIDDYERYSYENVSTSDAHINYSGEGGEYETTGDSNIEGTKMSVVSTTSSKYEDLLVNDTNDNTTVSRFEGVLTTLVEIITEGLVEFQEAENYPTEDSDNSSISSELTETTSTSSPPEQLELVAVSEQLDLESFSQVENLTSIQDVTASSIGSLVNESDFANSIFDNEELDTLENKANVSIFTQQISEDTSTILTLQPLQFSTEIIGKHFLQYQTTHPDSETTFIPSSHSTEDTVLDNDISTFETIKELSEKEISMENHSTISGNIYENFTNFNLQNFYESNVSNAKQSSKASESSYQSIGGITTPSTVIIVANNDTILFSSEINKSETDSYSEDYNVLDAEEIISSSEINTSNPVSNDDLDFGELDSEENTQRVDINETTMQESLFTEVSPNTTYSTNTFSAVDTTTSATVITTENSQFTEEDTIQPEETTSSDLQTINLSELNSDSSFQNQNESENIFSNETDINKIEDIALEGVENSVSHSDSSNTEVFQNQSKSENTFSNETDINKIEDIALEGVENSVSHSDSSNTEVFQNQSKSENTFSNETDINKIEDIALEGVENSVSHSDSSNTEVFQNQSKSENTFSNETDINKIEDIALEGVENSVSHSDSSNTEVFQNQSKSENTFSNETDINKIEDIALEGVENLVNDSTSVYYENKRTTTESSPHPVDGDIKSSLYSEFSETEESIQPTSTNILVSNTEYSLITEKILGEINEGIHSDSLEGIEKNESIESYKTDSGSNLEENIGTEANTIKTDFPKTFSQTTNSEMMTFNDIKTSTKNKIAEGLEKNTANHLFDISKPVEERINEKHLIDSFIITASPTDIINENSSTTLDTEMLPTKVTYNESQTSLETAENSKTISIYEVFGYLGGLSITGKSNYLPKPPTEIVEKQKKDKLENDTGISYTEVEMDSEIQNKTRMESQSSSVPEPSTEYDVHKQSFNYEETLHNGYSVNTIDTTETHINTEEVSQELSDKTTTETQDYSALNESSEIHNETLERQQKNETESIQSKVTDKPEKLKAETNSDSISSTKENVFDTNGETLSPQSSNLRARSRDDDPLADIEYIGKPKKPIIYSTTLSTQFQINSKKNATNSSLMNEISSETNQSSSSIQLSKSDLIPGVDIILPPDSVTFPSERKTAMEAREGEARSGNIHPYYDLVSNVFKAPGYDSELHSQNLRHGYSRNKATSRVKREDLLFDSSSEKSRSQIRFPNKKSVSNVFLHHGDGPGENALKNHKKAS